jgi:hypothetical protein
MNNHADRLAEILRRIHATDANKSIRATLMPIFGSATTSEFARSVGYFIELPDKVVSAVTAAVDPDYDDLDWYLRWKDPVDQVVSRIWNFDSRVEAVRQAFSAADVMNLEACGQLLNRARIERRIDPSTIEDIRQKTQDLHDALMDAEDLPSNLRTFMIDQLDRIARALREFVIRGPEAMTEVIDGAVGGILRVGATTTEPITPATRSWLEKFKAHLAVVSAAVSVTAATLALPAAVDQAVEVLTGSSAAPTVSEPAAAAESNGHADTQTSLP